MSRAYFDDSPRAQLAEHTEENDRVTPGVGRIVEGESGAAIVLLRKLDIRIVT